MRWIEQLAARIRAHLAASPISDAAKEEIVAEAIEDTEAGRPFNAPAPRKSALDDDRAALLAKQAADAEAARAKERLRLAARQWAGWENRF
jgi:hypothetical protein